jgi:pyruvate,water dikinase
MIHPLVWSVNTPLVNGAWIGLLTELIGPNDLKPEQLARSFYYRTYFEMGAFRRIFESFGFPPESLEMMMGVTNEPRKMPAFKMSGYTLRLLPRMLRFIGSKISFAKRVNQLLPVFQEQADGFAYQDLSQLDEAALLAQVDRLAELVHRVAYYNINTPLLMAIYNMVLRRQLRSNGIDFERLDVVKGLDELKQYQPAIELEALHRAFLTLPETARQMLQLQHSAALAGLEGGEGEAFRTRFYAFTGRFGHLSDSGNDFSVQPWREQPDLLLEMIINYRRASGSEAEKLGYANLQLPGWKKWMISGIYNRARQFRFLRERVGSLYTFAYGQFRRYFLELEQRLVRRGVLHTAGDIFMLNLDEVRRVVSGSLDGAQAVALAAARREEMHLCRDISLPEEIYGDDVKPLNMTVSRCLTGIPTSRGLYTGPVSVVNGIRDFGKVEPGAVLVVPFTDVGWTPLFARAGAVISESGGLLSHSSIIAREFSIPAVVSVENATTLPDHTVVTVDGYKGEITVH